MPDVVSTSTAGLQVRGYQHGATGASGVDQYVVVVNDRVESFRGRCSTFVTPGRAAVTQRLFAIHNATASPVIVSVNRVIIDVLQTVAKAPTVVPPIVRANRFTALPTGGTSLAKVPMDTQYSSNASVTCWGDSSADGTAQAGTLSASALTITPNPTTPLAQIEAPRLLVSGTAASGYYEPVDTIPFFVGEPDIILRALEGLVISLDQAVVTTGNPATDRWIAYVDWTEYTRP